MSLIITPSTYLSIFILYDTYDVYRISTCVMYGFRIVLCLSMHFNLEKFKFIIDII